MNRLARGFSTAGAGNGPALSPVAVCSCPRCEACPLQPRQPVPAGHLANHPQPRPRFQPPRSPSLVYSLTGLSLGKQQLVNTALLNAGKAFKLGSRDASPLQYNLQISRGIDQDGIRNALTFNGVRSPASQVLVPTRLPTITVVGKRRAARR